MTRISIIIVALFYLTGCSNNKGSDPYEDLLSQPPYSSLSDSINAEPGRDDLHFRRAVLLNTNNYPEPALADFKRAWSIRKDERYAFGIATIYLEKNPDSALLFLNRALQELPESILLGLSLARGYDARNKPDEALKICNDLLAKNPEQVDVLKMKASLEDKKGDYAASVRTMEKAYSITPFDVELNYMLAFRYAENKNPRVLSLADSLIRMDSLGLHAEPYYYKGLYYSNMNDKEKALGYFDNAIQHNYNFLDAHIEKGITLYEQKKYQEAYNSFNLAMTISPKYADAYYWMARSQEAMGQKQDAKLNYQRAYGLDNTLLQAKEGADRLSK